MRALIRPSFFPLSPTGGFVTSRYCDDKSHD
nr:MAG TPA: hypothetical protein [Caudoviricetes sp.]